MRVYEWGNEAGRKIMMVHGDATCAPLWKPIAEELVEIGCRVCVIGEFFEMFWLDGWEGRSPLSRLQ
jgi:hypothetical protein